MSRESISEFKHVLRINWVAHSFAQQLCNPNNQQNDQENADDCPNPHRPHHHYESSFRLSLTSCRNSIGRTFSWSACSRTCRPSSHNSTCPSSCRLRGKSSSVRCQTRKLRVPQERDQRLISPFSCHHLLSS